VFEIETRYFSNRGGELKSIAAAPAASGASSKAS
jgi:hypothetical protein